MLFACGHELPLESIRKRGRIIVDTLNVAIVLDETPGFSYPMMRHDIFFVGHLNVPGFIDGYEYQSGDVGFGVFIDYVAGYLPEAGEKFRMNQRLWSSKLIQAGSQTEYRFTAQSPYALPLTVDSSKTIETVSDGPRPVPNSQQLTGPENFNSRPVFSKDGQWIYFQGRDRENRVYSLTRIHASGGNPEVLIETQESIGGFALTEDDTKITYVIRNRNEKSKLVVRDLDSGSQEIIAVDGFIWSADLIPIPDSPQFISLSDPNVVDDDLILIDAGTGSVETLVSSDVEGTIFHFGHRPGTREISYGVRVNQERTNVILLNLETREKKTFLDLLEGYEFVWAPNGIDYAFTHSTGSGTNIFVNEAGNEQQVTFYPGADGDPSFSADARSLTFTSSRRGETQIWRVDF